MLTGNLVISTADKYFSKPSEFIPERWLRGQADESSQKQINSFVSLPFGFGPRSCIGRRFANLEIEVILAKVRYLYAIKRLVILSAFRLSATLHWTGHMQMPNSSRFCFMELPVHSKYALRRYPHKYIISV